MKRKCNFRRLTGAQLPLDISLKIHEKCFKSSEIVLLGTTEILDLHDLQGGGIAGPVVVVRFWGRPMSS